MGYSLTGFAGNDHFTISCTKRKGIPTYATIMIDISEDFLSLFKISLCGLLSFCQIFCCGIIDIDTIHWSFI